VNPLLLIAEGDDTLIDLFRQYCSRCGYDVETAAGGLECLRKLRRSSCQLLVLDVDLPWGGGDGVLALMREDPRLARIPVILISTTVRSDLVAPPVVHALRKPFLLNALLERVRSVVPKEAAP
jgi:CheY-like chemotaxis protein